MTLHLRSEALSGAAQPAPGDTRSFNDAAASYRAAPPPSRANRAVQFLPSTYNAETHTVEVVLSAGTDVRRWGYIERLLISPEAVNLTRVDAGAVKALNSHNAWDIGAILGTLQSTRFADGELLGLVRFGETAGAKEAEGMVARGELTHVSIGYEVTNWRAVEIIVDPSSGSEVTVWRAEEWTLLEVSFVSVPADPKAGVRSVVPQPGSSSAFAGGTIKETAMTQRTAGADAPAPASASPAQASDATRAAELAPPAAPPAPAAARFSGTEAVDFVEQGRIFGVETEARSLVAQVEAGTVSPAIARSTLLEKAAEKQRAATVPALAGARAGDQTEVTRNAIVDALVARACRKAPTDQNREFYGMRLLEIAILRSGLNPRERDPITILRAANTSSDFPLILEAAGNKILMERYQTAVPTYRAIAKQRDLRDFKPTKLLRIGDFPTLKEYAEDGEIQAGTINEGRESVTLGSYGRILRLSRQAIVNDDLGAFDDVFGNIGNVVARFENTLFWAMKAVNSGNGPKLADNVNLFNSAHGNLAGSGTVIDITNLGLARAAMRKQKDLDNNNLNLAPRILLVGPDKETQADQIVTSVTAAQSAYVNPFSGKLEVVTEGSISGNAWELYADPNQAAAFNYGYLADAPGPRVLTEEPFNVDGMAFRVTLDFYAGAVDYRPAYRNPGAS